MWISVKTEIEETGKDDTLLSLFLLLKYYDVLGRSSVITPTDDSFSDSEYKSMKYDISLAGYE